VFFGATIFSLFANLIPNKKPILMYNGKITYNDGTSLKRLIRYKKLPAKFEQAFEYYNQQDNLRAAALLDELLEMELEEETLLRLAMYSHLVLKNYKHAEAIASRFVSLYQPNVNDYLNIGLIYSQLDQHELGLSFYDKALATDSENKIALNNKGYTLNLLERYEEAILLFDHAIALDENFAYSYNNRGLSKLKLGRTEDGFRDIEHAISLDENNSYAYRNLGIYHLDLGNYSEANQLFEKAKSLDQYTHGIDQLIVQVNDQLNLIQKV
jgi:tetratricopeptide (TPR) repeat protein